MDTHLIPLCVRICGPPTSNLLQCSFVILKHLFLAICLFMVIEVNYRQNNNKQNCCLSWIAATATHIQSSTMQFVCNAEE